MSKPTNVLLTGGTGCLGSMILDQLLKEGYRVRATARPKKVHFITDTFPDVPKDRLEIVEMEDLMTGDWDAALKGMDAVMHVATPVYHPWVTGKEIYDASTTGMRKILDAVVKSGCVKKFVYTGSIGAFFKMDFSNVLTKITFDENTWAPTEESDINPDTTPASGIYIAAKAISEKIMWKYADERPEIDFTSILTSSVYGAFLPNYPTPTQPDELNGNKFILHLIRTDSERQYPPIPMKAVIHNRDNAIAHVRAIAAPPLPSGEKKRLIITAGNMDWVKLISLISEKRPELRGRLPDLESPGLKHLPPDHFELDTRLSERVLGMKRDDGVMIGWEDMMVESVDFLVEWEKKRGIKA